MTDTIIERWGAVHVGWPKRSRNAYLLTIIRVTSKVSCRGRKEGDGLGTGEEKVSRRICSDFL